MTTQRSGYPNQEQAELDAIQQERRQAYWRANVRLIRNLLIIWAFVSLGCSILFVPLLNQIKLGTLPLGFWMAQQGSIFAFVILIFVYAVQMDKLERKYRQ
jgi:putative solute:sodium symporter small subunit